MIESWQPGELERMLNELTNEMDSMPIEQQEELYIKTNPDYFVKVDLIDGKMKATFSCKKCGDVTIISKPNKNYTLPECKDCAKRATNPNFRGLLQENQVGRIYNGMEITAQYTDPVQGYLCDIKCAICGTQNSIKTGIPILDVMDRKYAHDCDYNKVNYKCPNCETISNVSIKEIMDSKDTLCQKCNHMFDKTDLRFELVIYDRKLNFNSARKRAYGTTVLPEVAQSVNSDIYYEKVPIYRSLNDNYYRCICLRHVSKFVLSETELINYYKCEKCHDIQEGVFKTLKAHNVLRSIRNPKEASVWKWDSESYRFVRRDE